MSDREKMAQASANRAWATVRVRSEENERLSDDARLLAGALEHALRTLATGDYWVRPDVAAALARHRVTTDGSDAS